MIWWSLHKTLVFRDPSSMSHHELHDLPIPANTSCKFPKYILTLYFTPQSMRPEAMIGRRPIPSPYQSSQRRSSRVVVVYSLVLTLFSYLDLTLYVTLS